MDRSYLSCRRAGNRVFSPASTAGRLRMIFFDFFVFQCTHGKGDSSVCFSRTCRTDGEYHIILGESFYQFQLVFASGMIGLPVTLNTITFPVCSACGAFPFIMSMMTSSFSELYSAQYFSSLVIFSSKAHISSSSPSTLMTLPRATMRSFGYKAFN